MKKFVLIACHFFFWIFTYLSVPYLFQIAWCITAHLERPHNGSHEIYYLENAYTASLILTMIGACIFYASYFSLYFFVKRPVRFIWILAFYVICSLVISLPADLISQQAVSKLGPVLYFNVCGFLFRTFIEWIRERKIRAELEKDKLTSQLELLKSKINPHFLFNTINNIDRLIQKDATAASEYLNKLSDIMRFMLYETKSETIALSKELSYIEKYIELQKIRTSNSNYIKYEVKGDAGTIQIEPMLFIPFIENAFKHTENKKIKNAIKICFEILKDKIKFECQNIYTRSAQLIPEHSGLGNELVERRLKLLYPGRHTFDTSDNNGIYTINLSIHYH